MCTDNLTLDRAPVDNDDIVTAESTGCGGTNPPTPTFTTFPTADVVDANLAPVSSEPVGAKREYRDFDQSALAHAPSAMWDLLGRVVFSEQFDKAFGDKPATTFLYPSDELDATSGKGLWATADQPGDNAILVRIA